MRVAKESGHHRYRFKVMIFEKTPQLFQISRSVIVAIQVRSPAPQIDPLTASLRDERDSIKDRIVEEDRGSTAKFHKYFLQLNLPYGVSQDNRIRIFAKDS